MATLESTIIKPMAVPASQKWNSATTLYIARKLEELSKGRTISVIDMGCGDGLILSQLVSYGYDLSGYDLALRDDDLRARLEPAYGNDYASRFKTTTDERRIPFADDRFDVVYANQVFEHVRFLDAMMSECARVLRPGGTLLINFPLATTIFEPHYKLPFLHWLPKSKLRVAYMYPFYALRLLPKLEGESPIQSARARDSFLDDAMYYRFMNEIRRVAEFYFEEFEIDTAAMLEAKLDLMKHSKSLLKRALAHLLNTVGVKRLSPFVTYCVNATFVMRNPRKQ
jgi:SAM-dependent methyltransferase